MPLSKVFITAQLRKKHRKENEEGKKAKGIAQNLTNPLPCCPAILLTYSFTFPSSVVTLGPPVTATCLDSLSKGAAAKAGAQGCWLHTFHSSFLNLLQ